MTKRFLVELESPRVSVTEPPLHDNNCVSYGYIKDKLVPDGGKFRQVLSKSNNNDHSLAWIDIPECDYLYAFNPAIATTRCKFNDHCNLEFEIDAPGVYKLEFSYSWNCSTTLNAHVANLVLVDNDTGESHLLKEIKQTATDSWGFWEKTGSGRKYQTSGALIVPLDSKNYSLTMRFKSSFLFKSSMWDSSVVMRRLTQ